MLYVTTRNKTDAYTSYHALCNDSGPNGGMYVPYQLPRLSEEQIGSLKDKSFGQCVADILNLFFSARLEALDVDFCVGKCPAKLVPMSHKIVVAETWHNPDWDFASTVRNLTARMRGADGSSGAPSNWAWIAIRIAMLFGLFGEISRSLHLASDEKLDVAVATGDFTAPMAVWYAQQMGLPVGTIICGCGENGSVWDLLHHGELHTDADVPVGLEQLIFGTLGWEHTRDYCEVCLRRGVYTVGEETLEKLRSGMFAAVVSRKRMESVIHSVYRTNTYMLGPDAALAYGGLQDYRASTGETRPSLILAERSAVCAAETVANALGITTGELKDRMGLG